MHRRRRPSPRSRRKKQHILLPIIMLRQFLCVGERAVVDEDILHAEMDHGVDGRARHPARADDQTRRRGPDGVSRGKPPAEAIADTDPVGVVAVEGGDGASSAFLEVEGGVLRGKDGVHGVFFVLVGVVANGNEGVYCADGACVRRHGVEEGDDFCFVGEADACPTEVRVVDESVEAAEGG